MLHNLRDPVRGNRDLGPDRRKAISVADFVSGRRGAIFPDRPNKNSICVMNARSAIPWNASGVHFVFAHHVREFDAVGETE
jgi:hypothetical protein